MPFCLNLKMFCVRFFRCWCRLRMRCRNHSASRTHKHTSYGWMLHVLTICPSIYRTDFMNDEMRQRTRNGPEPKIPGQHFASRKSEINRNIDEWPQQFCPDHEWTVSRGSAPVYQDSHSFSAFRRSTIRNVLFHFVSKQKKSRGAEDQCRSIHEWFNFSFTRHSFVECVEWFIGRVMKFGK